MGAVALIGGTIFFILYRKKQRRKSENAIATAPSTIQTEPTPYLYSYSQSPGGQQQPSPYSPGSQSEKVPISPGETSGYQPSPTHGATAPTTPPTASQPSFQQQQSSGQQHAPWLQQKQQQQQSYNRPISGHSASNIAPLPMWVERARTSARDDSVSATSVGNTSASHVVPEQPNSFYGSYYSGNTRA